MAAGDTKIRIQEIRIGRSDPVAYSASYSVSVEVKKGSDVQYGGGDFQGFLGTATDAGKMTLNDIQAKVLSDISGDSKTPEHDVIELAVANVVDVALK